MGRLGSFPGQNAAGPVTAHRPASPVAGRQPGRFDALSYTNAAGTRAYRLYVPGGYTGAPVPLVVMLHGGTQSIVDFAVGTGMNDLAESSTFIVVYPEQSRSANPMGYWNWFHPADQGRDTGEPSLIAGIVRHVMQEHPVDPDRVYVAGFSAGGAMAAVMATTHPDLFAAAGIHSGLPHGCAHDLASAFAAMHNGAPTRSPGQSPVPLLVFHGDRDDVVNPVNATRVIDQAGHSTSRQSHTSTDGSGLDGRSYTRVVIRAGDKPLEQWTVHGCGHAWSGGDPTGSYTDPQGPDASAEMLRFFAENPRHHRAAGAPGLTR